MAGVGRLDLDETLDDASVRRVMIHRVLRGVFNDQSYNAQPDATLGGSNG